MNCKQVHQFDAIVIICLALTWGEKFTESPQLHYSLNFIQIFNLLYFIIFTFYNNNSTSSLYLQTHFEKPGCPVQYKFVCVFVHVFMCL